MLTRSLAFVSALLLSTTLSTAAMSIEWVPVDNSSAMSGHTTVDLFITTDSGLCCAAMLMELDSGEFFYFDYVSPDGQFSLTAEQDQPPQQSIIDLGQTVPEIAPIEFTTYVTIAGEQAGLLAGGDVGGDGLEFSEQEIDVAWYSFDYPVGRAHAARITFTDGSTGSWALLTVEGAVVEGDEFSGTLADIVPEPASLTLLAIGSAALLRQNLSDRMRI